MLNVPRGVTVYENVPAAQYEGPAILNFLKESKLSGYARFEFPESAAHLLFSEGNLAHLVLETKEGALTGLEAVSKLFELIVREGGRLDAYSLSPVLTRLVLGFLRGTRIHEAQALRLLDRKALLEGIRMQKLTGVLHIYTPDRGSMIFYEEGVPRGFFQEGSDELGTSAEDFQNIASMPEAMVDVTRTAAVEESSIADLVEMINVDRIWQGCVSRNQERKGALDRSAADRLQAAREAAAVSREEQVTEICGTYLGKMGRALAQKEIAARGGRNALLDPASSAALLAAIEKGAKLLTSGSKTKEMLAALGAALSGRDENTVR